MRSTAGMRARIDEAGQVGDLPSAFSTPQRLTVVNTSVDTER